MALELRTITPEEFDAWFAAESRGFHEEVDEENRERVRRHIDGGGNWSRTLATFDGNAIVSTAGAIPFSMSVPGGELPTAGVTAVTVLPTHRRRGLLREMMRRQLDDVRERGEPLAALIASESIIYGRFGYGLACPGVNVRIDRRHTDIAYAPEAPGRVRFVTREEALARWPAVHERVRAERAGIMARDERWWEDFVLPEPQRGSGQKRQLVEYQVDGVVEGYARYRIRQDWTGGLARSALSVGELLAANDGATAALWRYLFGVDLVETIEAQWRPADETLAWMLADPRRLERRQTDVLWVRLVDVERALAGRTYAGEGRLVLEVRDAFGPWAAGRYVLDASPEGANCRRTEATPELTLDARDLAAGYLGGVRFSTLARAGRVEGAREALLRADALFASEPAPWCFEEF